MIANHLLQRGRTRESAEATGLLAWNRDAAMLQRGRTRESAEAMNLLLHSPSNIVLQRGRTRESAEAWPDEVVIDDRQRASTGPHS